MVIDIWKYLKPKKEEEKEKTDYLKNMEDRLGIPQYTNLVKETQKKEIDFSKYIVLKGEAKTGVGAKAEGGVKLETKKEEPSAFDTLNESIEKNYKQYQSMTKKLESYQAEYDYAPENIKPSIAANFNKLVGQNNDLVKQLQSDIGKRDQMITTINKAKFMRYKQLTGLPGEAGYNTPIFDIAKGIPKETTISTYIPPKETLWNKIGDLLKGVPNIGGETPEAKNAKAQVSYNISQETKIPITTIEQNLDKVTKQLGIRGIPTTGEYVSAMFKFPIMYGLIMNPISAGIGITEYLALTEGINYVGSVMKKWDYKFGAGKGVKDLLPEETSQFTKDVVGVAEFLGKIYLIGKFNKSIKSLKLWDKFTKDATIEYNLPQNLYIGADKLKSMSIEQAQEMGLTNSQYMTAREQGIDVEIPITEVIKWTDKSWYAKLKGAFGIEPSSITTVRNLGEKPTVSPSIKGLLGEPATVNLYTGLPIDKIVGDITKYGKVTVDMVKGLEPAEVLQIAQQLTPGLATEFLRTVMGKPVIPTTEGKTKEEVSLAKPQTKEEIYAEKYNIPLEKVKITELPPGKKEPLTEGLEPELPEFKEEIEREPTAEELSIIEMERQLPENLKKPVPPELKADYLKIIGKEVKLARDKMKLASDIRKDITPSPEILVKYPNLIKELSKPELTKIEIPKVEIPESLKKPVPPELKNEYLKIIQKEVKLAIDKLKIIKDIKEGKPISEGILGKYPELTEKLAKLSETKPAEIKVEAVMPEEKIEKPMVEPEEIEPEPTPEEIRATFMEEENLGTTVKNREYFLSKFGKLFTETKKIEGTLLKEKFNEMQSMIEYEEDDIFKLASGKEKMRIPKTTKTEWMEGLGKGKYMQIFREDKNLQYPDEIASNLGISENELREQIIERIRTAPEKVTLEGAKQALIDERNSIFMQVNAQMDAYRILLDEIEGGEYSFDTPQNIKRLNAKINTIKDDNKKLMERYEKEITELQKEGIEKRYEELKKKTEAIKNIEVEIGIKKGVKEVITGKKLKGLSAEEIKQGNQLMGEIYKTANQKGLNKTQLNEIKRKYGYSPHLATATKRMAIPQLQAVLKAVQQARPITIGYKDVVTLKTEDKIQSLKDNLINKLQMTEETYQEVLKSEGVYKEPKYIDAKNFITEEKGKKIIYRLIDEANILKITLPLKNAIEKNPLIKKEWEKIVNRVKLEGDRKLKDPHELRSMRWYAQKMEIITKAPIYTLYQDLINVHLENRAKLGKLIKEFEEYKEILKDEKALKRINDYIASKSILKNKPESPKDITPREIEMAKKIEGILKDYEARARTEMFLNNIDHPEDMPQYLQYKKEINKAKDIYESKGYDDLTEYLKTQEWGTIRSGYSPLQVIFSKIRVYKPKPQTFSKTHIQPRTDIEYKESDRNIVQRLISYKKQMDNLVSMRPKVRALITLVEQNLDKFENPQRVKTVMEVFFRELKGYNRPEGLFRRLADRLYAQAIQTVILISPGVAGQNILQNVAMGFDKSILIDPRNKSLTDSELDYLNTYIIQTESIKADWLMVGEKPIIPLPIPYGMKAMVGLMKLLNKIGFYPYSEGANRHWMFWGKINQVKRAFDNNNDLSQQTKDAKFSDMELLERKMALEILAKDGIENMSEYVTRVHIEDIEFNYDRAQRSPAEMGEMGKWMSNLMLFPRAYWEIILKQARKFTGKNIPFNERLRAFKVLANIIIGGWLVGAAYKKVTGRVENPYDPWQLLGYKAGGLALSGFDLATDVYVDLIMASKGDERSLANLATELPALADMFIPFYNYTLRALEASTDTKNIDKLALRKLRMLIDKEYKVRGGAYILERNAMEKWQYFLMGSGVDVTIKEREKKEKEKGKFPMKVKVPKGSKSIKPKFPMKVKVPKK